MRAYYMLSELLKGMHDASGCSSSESSASEPADGLEQGPVQGPVARYNPQTGQVTSSMNPTEIWGRVTVVREGQPSEALSCYCRAHGCSILRRTRDAPDWPDILNWFTFGQTVPAGRTPTLRLRHERAMPRAKAKAQP